MIVPCKYGSNCNRQNPQHFIEFSHPPLPVRPGPVANTVQPGQPPKISRIPPASAANNTQAITKIACKYGINCEQGNSEHYEKFSHPKGPCSQGAQCASHKNGHLLSFEHTPKQIVSGLSADILKANSGSVTEIKYENMLTHTHLENLHDYSTLVPLNGVVKGTGFTPGFLKAAFLHGVYVASEQFKHIKYTTIATKDGFPSIATLHSGHKIKFAYGPSLDALQKVSAKIAQQKMKTIAPLADPSKGFKWEEMKNAHGVHKFDSKKGLHLLSGCYHSTTNEFASAIFDKVKMCGTGYLGNGMYFTVSPTEDAKADDLDAILKTSTYGLLYGGIIIVSMVVGYDGILYVQGQDVSMPSGGNWDLKYLPKGLKDCNYGFADQKNRGAAELVATDASQVLPLGIIYVEDAQISSIEASHRKELLKKLEKNAQWIENKL
jgi:hypothetical protein